MKSLINPLRNLLAIMLVASGASQYSLQAQAPDYNHLVNYWKLDGTAEDTKGANDGTFVGTVAYTNGPNAGLPKAAALVPVSYINAGTNYGAMFEYTNAFSASAWILGYLGAYQNAAVVGKLQEGGPYTGWELHVSQFTPGILNVWIISDLSLGKYINVNAIRNVLDGTWHHVAFTYDGSGLASGVHIYVDGQDDTASSGATDQLGGGSILNSTDLDIGVRQDGANNPFRGRIGGVSTWSSTLTSANVNYIYTNGINPPVVLGEFYSDKTLINAGDPVTFTWQVASGASVSIDQGVGDVTSYTANGLGSIVVNGIVSTRTLTLTASASGKTATRQVTIAVNPLINSFTAGRPVLPLGASEYLTWSIHPSPSHAVLSGIGDVTAITTNGMGYIAVAPASTTTYTLEVDKGGTTNTASLTVVVTNLPATSPGYGNLIAYWTLNGNTLDSFGGHDGQFIGSTNYTIGPSSNTLSAQLTYNNYIAAGTAYDPLFETTNAFSAALWIKGMATNASGANINNAGLIGKMAWGGSFAGWKLQVGDAGAGILNLWLINNYGLSMIRVLGNGNVLDGTWHHVAFTYDGSGLAAGVHIYVDAVDATGATTDDYLGSTSIMNTAPLTIGSHSGNQIFGGDLAQVSVWSARLTPNNIASIFEAGVSLPTLITSFAANAANVWPGTPLRLSWQVAAGAAVSIDSGVGDVTALTTNGVGSIVVVAGQTNSFTLTATKGGQTLTRPLFVNTLPAILSLKADRNTLPQGSYTLISWQADPFGTLSLEPVGSVLSQTDSNGNGSLVVAPTATTTYTLTQVEGGVTNQAQLMITVTPPSPIIAPALNNLVSFWSLDGNTLDASGLHNGIFENGASYTAGPLVGSQAASLNGLVPNFIDTDSTFNQDIGTAFSAMCWVKGMATNSNGGHMNNSAVIGKMQWGSGFPGWELHVGADAPGEPGPGILNVWLINNFGANYIWVNSYPLVLDGSWHHVGFTYDGSGHAAGLKIYVDGEDATGVTMADTLTGSMLNPAKLCIGIRQSQFQPFAGDMHGAAIWNTALAPDQMRYIYVKDAPFVHRVQLRAPRLAAPSGLGFSWNSIVGSTYTVESSADLAIWTPVVTGYPAGGAQTALTSYTNTAAGPGKLFYRVRSEY